MPPIIPQIVGLLAVVTFLLSYQQKKRRHIILLNVTSRTLYILQYLLLGAFSGAALDVMGAISSVLAGKKHALTKRQQLVVLLTLNTVIVALGLLIAWWNQSLLDLLPIVGVLLHTGAFWISDERIIRRISLLGSPFWFVYNFLSHAYFSAVGDILTMVSILIAMVRYRRQRNVGETDAA